MAKIENSLKKFGQTLRQLREDVNWTQEELADELDVDRAYVSQLERGIQNPSLKTMIRLAKVFSAQVSFAGIDLI